MSTLIKTIVISEQYHKYVKQICKIRHWTMEQFHNKFLESVTSHQTKQFYDSLPNFKEVVKDDKPLSNTKIRKFCKIK